MSEVNLIAVSKPSAITDCINPGELLAYIARVSNPENQNNKETSSKLVRYLIKNSHWSPFEMVHMTLEIVTTRDIARQILRHRSFSFQEFSQRYAKVNSFITDREARIQDQKNRQNSIETNDKELKEQFNMKQSELVRKAKEVYDWALDNGIAKEQARVVLPEGLTQSRMYMAGSLRSWIHYIDFRCSNGTEREHKLIADKCKELVLIHFPELEEYWSQP